MNLLFHNPVEIEGTLYIVSDFHLGTPNAKASAERESLIIRWLNEIGQDATHLILLGDIFDFWFEYRDVVPKGYFKFLAALHQLVEKGVKIYYFTGNHDMWVKDYFTKELNITVFRKQMPFLINGKKCLIGHGDGLGPTDRGYKFIKWLFAQKFNVKLYGALHPRIAFGLARFLSRKSRAMTSAEEEKYMGDEKETIVQYALSVLQNEKIDYFIYGHRHLPIEKALTDNAFYFNSGDWLMHNSYLKVENGVPELKYYTLQ